VLSEIASLPVCITNKVSLVWGCQLSNALNTVSHCLLSVLYYGRTKGQPMLENHMSAVLCFSFGGLAMHVHVL
jgi:hypothetical protein